MSNNEKISMSRRSLCQAAGVGIASLSLGAVGIGSAHAAAASQKKNAQPEMVRPDGRYDTVPLAKDVINLGVVQTRVRAVDGKNPARGLKQNLDHMLLSIDRAFYYGSYDILQFHEFPITGWDKWTRKESLRLAIELPGKETEIIGKKAKEYGCYIVFGSYVRDPDWPGHVLSITTIIGPDGSIVDKHWKARNIKGAFPGFELFTTTIYDVLDEYIERYGADAIVPVTKTPIGNIATSAVQREPELFRAFAMKGTEIMLRTSSGGYSQVDVQACAMYNGFYTTNCNNAVSPGNGMFFEDESGAAGNSVIYGPRGELLAQGGKHEMVLSARIPIQQFRATNRQPVFHKELVMPIYEQYQGPYEPNLFTPYQPSDLTDAKRYLADKSRWK